ncbi:YfhO family protein [Elizabethkingia meningoseptica]|uniref:YfhO family protein n=1 Tax=Elizabethkingia meningoseptica TaxID=238 RepID=UPI002011D02B|nr:YfhO family protein [Elizabethkingia meningoseptica]MCL1675586.1 YfhO family protein [Elizabethkingia meningoseptica]MCL1686998.1 YfhO family protein [Elizabethkingia meningoseptica]
MNLSKKNSLFIGISLVLFILLAVFYANPILTGKELIQPDIVHYRGGAQEMLEYRAKNGSETYWSDAMFGGMPTYQTGAQFRGDIIKKVDDVLNFLPKPANYLFLLFSGFFFLGMVALRNWKYALLGATFFGLSTYFCIIIAAGHNGKVHTIAYFAPLLASVLLVYIRRNYFWGFVATTLFMALQIMANHPQMTYYLFIGFGFFFLSELLRAILKTKDYKHFFISTAIVGVAMALGLGMNSQRMLSNAEYVKETVRGKQILSSPDQQGDKHGMDKSSITLWSYGQLETLNLFIPRLMGGASQEEGSDKMTEKLQQLVQENATSQEEVNNMMKGLTGSLTYWGDQPGTSGPAYQGAVVVFLALLGFFFAWPKYRWWILGTTVLTIMLAWGSNFMPLTDFFIDFVPMYNKFRAPSSILVVVELLFPFIAIIGLYRFFTDEKLTPEYKQKVLLYTTGGVVGITLILIVAGKSLLGFHTDMEGQYLPSYLLDYLVGERYAMFRTDAIKAILYVIITAGVLFAAMKQKLNQNVALIIIGVVSLFDLWTVNKRYLNNDNFADKTFARNPFITEASESYLARSNGNSYIEGLLQQAPVNQALENIAKADKQHYRVFNTLLGPFNETNTSYFVNSVGGYSAAKLRRYDDLINKYFNGGGDPNILNLLNTKYVLVADNNGIQAKENPYANGPAWFVSEAKIANTPNEEIDLISKVDNKKVAVIGKEDAKYLNGKTLQADPAAKIEIKNYQPNEIVYETSSATPQLAVISEIYYPHGWKFYIDGKETDYIKADYLLRAVHVPAGKHEIKMAFEPEVIRKGKTISLSSVGIFILLAALGFIFINRKSSKSQEHKNI